MASVWLLFVRDEEGADVIGVYGSRDDAVAACRGHALRLWRQVDMRVECWPVGGERYDAWEWLRADPNGIMVEERARSAMKVTDVGAYMESGNPEDWE